MELAELQRSLRKTYYQRDSKRGRDATFRHLAEEVGELAKALRTNDPENLRHEFADVLAWVVSLANLTGVDVDELAQRYAVGCPKCGAAPCACPFGP